MNYSQIKYADGLDKFLMIFGVIAALVGSGVYPLLFLMYGESANIFVEIAKDQIKKPNSTTTFNNLTNATSNATNFNKW